jgi:type II secretory pathway pseudopilin PulG
MRRQLNAYRAFTIVEMLIASAITLGMVVLLGTIFGSITRTASRANQRTDSFRDARAALQMMQRDLSGLVRNQRDSAGTPITLPTAYLVCTSGSAAAPANIYDDPVGGNQQIFALVALKNSGAGDVCSVGYYCRWDDQGGNSYSLRRFFRNSVATYSSLSSAGTYAAKTALYLPDAKGTATNSMKDELLASHVWNLKIIAYDKAGVVINSYPYEWDPDAITNNAMPGALEISFNAMSSEAARTIRAVSSDPRDWMDSTRANYQRLVGPNAYEFRTRVYFNQ